MASTSTTQPDTKPPLPPFTRETAHIKVKAAQDLWNTRDPHKVKNGYTADSIWRNRDQFLRGTDEIVAFLTKKWERENGYRLRKELFAFTDNKVDHLLFILVREGSRVGKREN
jgi:nuclear transport factor 2 (NTF2) superfamily protein